MTRYKRTPQIVDAWQFTGKPTLKNVRKFCEKNGLPQFNVGSLHGKTGIVIANTIQTKGVVESGDYIVRDNFGRLHPEEKDFFEANHAVVDEELELAMSNWMRFKYNMFNKNK